eukprot:TRINITY_DN10472_c0_g1_i8.p1 TRINITY_DN10472_c0_g1~~TRINITY_DN10472_c0_g1_i8.p1  ORF type:complete len:231 (+),score=-22.49 TRINITY_DN10472_c0_g1_i8:463-1155(+)
MCFTISYSPEKRFEQPLFLLYNTFWQQQSRIDVYSIKVAGILGFLVTKQPFYKFQWDNNRTVHCKWNKRVSNSTLYIVHCCCDTILLIFNHNWVQIQFLMFCVQSQQNFYQNSIFIFFTYRKMVSYYLLSYQIFLVQHQQSMQNIACVVKYELSQKSITTEQFPAVCLTKTRLYYFFCPFCFKIQVYRCNKLSMNIYLERIIPQEQLYLVQYRIYQILQFENLSFLDIVS